MNGQIAVVGVLAILASVVVAVPFENRAATTTDSYVYVHDGHCDGGWIRGFNTKQNTIEDCFEKCYANSRCGYFAFDESGQGSTNCALYTAEGGCPDDDRYPAYNSYKNIKGNSCYDIDIDYRGNDLNNGRVTKKISKKECQQLCQENASCVAFTWVQLNVPEGPLVGRERECWIKHTKSPSIPLKYVVSGPKNCETQVCKAQTLLQTHGTKTGSIENADVNESSGLIASKSGILWTHNDGQKQEDPGVIYAFDKLGTNLGTFTLDNILPHDLEDITQGTGPDPNKNYIYLGDIGNNKKVNGVKDQPWRSEIIVYRFPEPEPDVTELSKTIQASDIEKITISNPSEDIETLMFDNSTGDIYLVSKDRAGKVPADAIASIYKFTPPEGYMAEHDPIEMTEVGKLTGNIGYYLTAGDISPDGSKIILGNRFPMETTPTGVWMWTRTEGETVEEALKRAPCELKQKPQANCTEKGKKGNKDKPLEPPKCRQTEAISFNADGSGFYSTSEVKKIKEFDNAPIYYYELN